ncbi:hypothetical protein DPEC_G00065730 [Dallia pectoralis]|uniref:Uncharacterized protein n=1 Tax=Dallia pectoralis TaxID=75939 RepID=A0ACC2H8F7_DALPE|nr:hypothetical protein DPEC_G00065730 [Dallia pectoralis]
MKRYSLPLAGRRARKRAPQPSITHRGAGSHALQIISAGRRNQREHRKNSGHGLMKGIECLSLSMGGEEGLVERRTADNNQEVWCHVTAEIKARKQRQERRHRAGADEGHDRGVTGL